MKLLSPLFCQHSSFLHSVINRFIYIGVGLPGGSDSKEPACHVQDLGLIPGLGRSPREGHHNTLQYSCLENPMDRGAWRAAVLGVAKSCTQLRD